MKSILLAIRMPVSQRITSLTLHGSVLATLLSSFLLITHDSIALSIRPRERTALAVFGFISLLCLELLFYKKHIRLVNISLAVFYHLLAGMTLLIWGISSPIGLLVMCFAVMMPGILMGSRAIIPAALATIGVLWVVHFIHANGYMQPAPSAFSNAPSHWNIVIYGTIFCIVALVSRLSVRLYEESLDRASQAETKLRTKQDALKIELEKESTALRLEQLKQIHQLHKFALLGQSTAATLHELSNHLSVLNLDIDDLRQQHSNSRAISNAAEGIEHINRMVRQARRRLNTYETEQTFNAIAVITRTMKDVQGKFHQHHIKLSHARITGSHSFIVSGSTMALMQIMTILLNNALDACCASPTKGAHVRVSLLNAADSLTISIADTGIGINAAQQATLFQPIASTKSSGLGVGLFIARNLVEGHFNGTITFQSSNRGTHFVITLPRQPLK